jgi:hypothetical protein
MQDTSVIFKKLRKVNNHPLGEHSPNLLVTLKIATNLVCVGNVQRDQKCFRKTTKMFGKSPNIESTTQKECL